MAIPEAKMRVTLLDGISQGLRNIERNFDSFNSTVGKVGRILSTVLMGTGAFAGFTRLAAAAGEMEQAFAKMHPELQNAAGSLNQWNKSAEQFKAAMGGIISGVLSPMRAVLAELLDSWSENILRAQMLGEQIIKLQALGSPAAAALAQRLIDLQNQRAQLASQRGGAVAGISTAELIGGAWAASGSSASAANPVNKLAAAVGDLDRQIAETQKQLNEMQDRAVAILKGAAAAQAAGKGISITGTGAGVGAGISGIVNLTTLDVLKFPGMAFRGLPEQTGEGTLRDIEEAMINLAEGPMGDTTALAKAFTVGMQQGMAGLRAAGGAPPDLWEKLKGILAAVVARFQSLSMIVNYGETIMNAFWTALQPVIDQLAGPLVGALVIIGQTMAALIAPALQILAPVIELVAQAFVWLYNNAIVPLGNVFIGLFTAIGNLAKLIWYIITLQWGKIGTIKWGSQAGFLQPISVGTLGSVGAAAVSGTSGASTTYSAGRDITVNVVVNSEVITGENGGLRELALIINREITNAMALGVI